MLVNCKLLQADFPRQDDRWINFYSKLTVVDESEIGLAATRGRYELIASLVALITLSQGSTDVKAKVICELFSGRKLLKRQPLGIRVNNANLTERQGNEANKNDHIFLGPRNILEEKTKRTVLTKD